MTMFYIYVFGLFLQLANITTFAQTKRLIKVCCYFFDSLMYIQY